MLVFYICYYLTDAYILLLTVSRIERSSTKKNTNWFQISTELQRSRCYSQVRIHSTYTAKVRRHVTHTAVQPMSRLASIHGKHLYIACMIVFGKIMCLILDMTTESNDSTVKTKLPTLQRVGLLILWVCLIWLVTPQFIIQQNNTGETCRQTYTAQLFGLQHCPAILNDLSTRANNLPYPERSDADGYKNYASSVRVYKNDLNICTLLNVVCLEVASVNSNGHLNKKIHISISSL